MIRSCFVPNSRDLHQFNPNEVPNLSVILSVSYRFHNLSLFVLLQVWLPHHIPRGGAEAPESPLHKWAPLRSVLPGVLGGVGPARPAVPAVLVLVRWLPYHGGPPPQRPAGRPRRVRHGSHKPELLLLSVQRAGLLLRFYVLRLLGQRGFLLLPLLLRDAGGFFHPGLFLCFSEAPASFQKGNPSKAG